MVKNNLNNTVLRETHTCTAEDQSRQSEEPGQDLSTDGRSEASIRTQPQSRHCKQHPTCHGPDVESDTSKLDWDQVETVGKDLPTHFRTCRSQEELNLVKNTHQQLQHSGYYWGVMTMEEAHNKLTHTPPGTFLIRDSGQPDVFFTLSYQNNGVPTSVRILLSNQLFSLHGSNNTFTSLFALLWFYTRPSCKLTLPYRRQRPELLKQISRRAVVCTYGAETICTLPGLSNHLKEYVKLYPHGT